MLDCLGIICTPYIKPMEPYINPIEPYTLHSGFHFLFHHSTYKQGDIRDKVVVDLVLRTGVHAGSSRKLGRVPTGSQFFFFNHVGAYEVHPPRYSLP